MGVDNGFQGIRETYFRDYHKWLLGEIKQHPSGLSGLRWVVDPYEQNKDCWEKHPKTYSNS